MGYTSFSFAPDESLVVDKILKYICDIIIIVCIAFFILNFFCNNVDIVGNSMSPTLTNDEKVFVNTLAYSIKAPGREDVVVFDAVLDTGEVNTYVKRIIAIPGDTVLIKNGKIYVNDNEYTTKTDESVVNAGNAKNKITLDTDEYFVIGDNINNSEDSRFVTIGLLNKSDIIGKAWFVASPFKDIKFIK